MRVRVSPIVNDVHHAVASAALRSRNTVPSCRDRPCRCRCWTGNVVHPARRRFRLGWIFHMACTISHGIGKMGSDPCDVTGICAMSRPHAAWVHSAARSSSGTSAGPVVRGPRCVCEPDTSVIPQIRAIPWAASVRACEGLLRLTAAATGQPPGPGVVLAMEHGSGWLRPRPTRYGTYVVEFEGSLR